MHFFDEGIRFVPWNPCRRNRVPLQELVNVIIIEPNLIIFFDNLQIKIWNHTIVFFFCTVGKLMLPDQKKKLWSIEMGGL